MKLVKIGLVATALAAAVAFVGVGRPDFARGSAPSGRTVTVTGNGSVESVPNQAGLSVGVSSDAATAQAALAADADKAANVIEALRAAGVAKTDLQTTDVTVSPSWDNGGRQDGFTAHSSVQVKVASVSRAGAIIDAAVAAGATETSGPSFDRSDRRRRPSPTRVGRRRPWRARPARASARCSGSRSHPACRRCRCSPRRRTWRRRSSPARPRCRRR